jgi:GMP synthase-like glutamine amidotransferase
MRALFVQQDHVSPIGPIGQAMVRRGYTIEELLVVPAQAHHSPSVTVRFPEPSQYDVIVPMGAPWSVYDHARIGSWVLDEITFLRTAHDEGVPILAICFGAQALAAALGGSVVASDRPEIGWTLLRTDRHDLIEPGPWFEWHHDRWVLPSGLEAIAHTDVSQQAFVVGRSLGVQFHPEMTPAMLEGWLGNGGEAQARESGVDPDRLRSETAAHGEAAVRRSHRLVDRFLDQVATGGAAIGAGA